jgi:hypothetical protein
MTKINQPNGSVAAREAEARNAILRRVADENLAQVRAKSKTDQQVMVDHYVEKIKSHSLKVAFSDYSFKDVGQLGRRLVALSKTGKPNEKVGILSEAQMLQIWAK